MARPLKPLVHSGGWYPSKKWIPLVRNGGYTTQNGGEQPEPEAVLKTVTGSLIHITDALALPAEALSVNVEPIQDLNGYDNPWPAGGGKNKLAFPYAEDTKTNNGVTFTVNDDGTVRINGTATARGVFYLQNDVSNFHPDAGTYYVSKGSECQSATIIVEAYNGTTWKKNLATVATAVSVQFTIDYDGYDRVSSYISVSSGNSPSNEIVKPMFRLSSVTDATFAPYSNICPISGWTECKVTRTGKNMIDDGYSALKTNEVTLPTGTYYLQAFITENPSKHTTKSEVYINGEWETVTTPFSADGGRISITGNEFGWLYNNAMQTIVVTSGTCTIRCNRNDAAMLTRRLSLSTEQQTEFSPYVGTTYPISLGQTVYGGTLDVLTGVLTVTMAMVDLGTLTWTSISGNRKQCTELTNSISKPSSTTKKGNLIAERYANANASDLFSDSSLIGIGVNISGYLIARTSGEDVSGKLVYELATPIEVQLTPTQVELLQGENIIWSDGEMTLVYLADGNASDEEALNILLGGRYVNNHTEDEPTDREALDILLGGNTR